MSTVIMKPLKWVKVGMNVEKSHEVTEKWAYVQKANLFEGEGKT